MQHNLTACDSPVDQGGVGQIAGENLNILKEFLGQKLKHSPIIAGIVMHKGAYLGTCLHKAFGYVAADEAAGSGDQHFFGMPVHVQYLSKA
jgi:hypothetical protein